MPHQTYTTENMFPIVPVPTVTVLDPATTGEVEALDPAGGFRVDSFTGEQPAVADVELDDELDLAKTAEHDTGDLYGVVTQQAVDNALTTPGDPEQFVGDDKGQSWIEALSASATENGAVPEAPIDVEDELTSPASRRDQPVADRGSGGPGGR
jgi:hypothetical protein